MPSKNEKRLYNIILINVNNFRCLKSMVYGK